MSLQAVRRDQYYNITPIRTLFLGRRLAGEYFVDDIERKNRIVPYNVLFYDESVEREEIHHKWRETS